MVSLQISTMVRIRDTSFLHLLTVICVALVDIPEKMILFKENSVAYLVSILPEGTDLDHRVLFYPTVLEDYWVIIKLSSSQI